MLFYLVFDGRVGIHRAAGSAGQRRVHAAQSDGMILNATPPAIGISTRRCDGAQTARAGSVTVLIGNNISVYYLTLGENLRSAGPTRSISPIRS